MATTTAPTLATTTTQPAAAPTLGFGAKTTTAAVAPTFGFGGTTAATTRCLVEIKLAFLKEVEVLHF